MPLSHTVLPDVLHSAAQVRDLDARLIAAGTPGLALMERAADACWQALRERWPDANEVTVLAGNGNNGGDGFLIAALARQAGWPVTLYTLTGADEPRGDAAAALARAREAGVGARPWKPGARLAGVIVDALLGTGLSREVSGMHRQAIEAINTCGLPVLAVDIPSGLNADTGHVMGCAVQADLTLTFIGLKLGLFTGEAAAHVGQLLFASLGADSASGGEAAGQATLLRPGNLPQPEPRRATAHKGQFGRVLVVGGEHGTGGAALMAAEAALRSGAGMVSLATRAEHVAPALTRLPEVMTTAVASANQLPALLSAASVLVAGPGLGTGAWGRSLLSVVAGQPKAQVWDADALNLLAEKAVQLPPGAVLTPHPGEAARLLGLSVKEVQADRPGAVRALARTYQAVCVLKGAGSLIAAPEGRLAVCNHGHPAMATAGLGDVLSGLIGALLAQHMPAFEAACLGVWLHARAGEVEGARGRGLAAVDLIPTIRRLLEEVAPCKA
ncbi:bifunctional ADP-dependent NAD(P)H-hydrate dehydratase/NAD(P)H-hydrate epimerase [Pseudomonas massiliensis]|uniref:bifunctional ADP-dependent NAD(P)H-hydrate dehydratase/NAD(P)H-hydrate epimerase n=1 Tax=Pseudomonas massiliensis TaxID=522492 RepID=UPI00058D65DF|nr:bifunctional ADP-dependent NAD(P)H-hydrate dehydratase/NAD(P)H-hydrate epimerase [Pseudomonas massiliensis]